MNLLRRHPLTVFFVLAFGATWAIWVPRAAGAPVGIIGELSTWAVAVMPPSSPPPSPAVGPPSSIWVLGWCGGGWAGGGTSSSCSGRLAFSLTTAGIYMLLGASWASAAPRFLAGNLALLPLLVLVSALTDGLGEELGWRGFAPTSTAGPPCPLGGHPPARADAGRPGICRCC